ncbi:Putative ubiquitin system component CUE [Septoria linicola]|uniref:RNA polymerase II degradation factor 1 n=1 Tax=Septoria linicola TaxID=215465 RepID=A0A9Q9AXU4_9PEZI|nr:Putative ubiquitin system component CUE [Septoria linicola]
MSETAPSRGRSSARGGRGGLSRGGPRGGRKLNGTSNDAAEIEESLEDQGEIGEMKKKYQPELGMLKDMFPDWTDTDLVFAIEEAGGDVGATVDKITQGAVSQFAEVKKPKDRARSKVPAESTAAGASDRPPFSTRGARGRGGFEGARGGRGRGGADRGRGGFRGGRGGHATTNGLAKDAAGTSVPTTESTAWDTPAANEASGGWDDTAAEPIKNTAGTGDGVLGTVTAVDPPPAAAAQPATSSVIEQSGAKKSWASMFAAPKPAPAPVVPKQILTKPQAVELDATEQPRPEPVPSATEFPSEAAKEAEPVPEALPEVAAPVPEPEPAIAAATPENATATAPVERPVTSEVEGLTLTPSKDPLTEENVEHLPDDTLPPATHTVASTAGSADPRNLTPLPTQQAPIGRPPVGGYATVANRLAGHGGRSASFQRRVQEQQEAVVMPGHNAVDRAAVQFGSMGLNGEAGPDVDEEREEAETRHAPQHSPPAQPRTSLPPAPRQASAAQEPSLPEAQPQAPSQAQPTPKQAPGLPPASAQNQQQIQDPSLGQGGQDQQFQQGYNQYGRGYAQQQSIHGGQQDSGAQQQKQYDPFSHQAQPSQYDQYGHNQQAAQQQHQQPQQQHQSGFGGLSSAPSDYGSSYYTADANRYNQYYGGSYGGQESRQQAGQPHSHDPTIGQQRTASGYGAGINDAAFAGQGHQQSRFAEAPGSGSNTPNPIAAQQQQPTQSAQHSLQQQQGHSQQPSYNSAGYPYGHPYYNSPYQQAYVNQFTGYGGGYGGGSGYGGAQGGYQGKAQQQQQQQSMYGAPQNYGSSYEQHSASPANTQAFSQNQRSTSGMGSSLGGLDDYGRGSAAPSAHQQSNAYGSMHDPFARSASGFGAQGGYGQQAMGGQEDSLKAYDSAKSGPSPSLGQPGRPGSAANSAAGNAQSGLPPPQQGQHSAFGGGYQGFPSQGSQYNSLGGLGGHQQGQQGAGYGYGAGFNQTYGNYGQSRGGWGQNYGAH